MRLPTDVAGRDDFYRQLIADCMVTREERRRDYAELKRYYMYGCGAEGNPGETVNKIFPHLDQLLSFVYSQETTRFNIELGTSVNEAELGKVDTVNETVNQEWHDSNTDIVAGHAVRWAYVYASTLLKSRWNGRAYEPFMVSPHNFGVLREDIPFLSRQEAFCEQYLMTKTQLERELTLANHPRKSDILEHVVASHRSVAETGISVGNIVVSQVTPQILGNVDVNLSSVNRYNPKVAADLIQMYELYAWNNATNDWQIITCADAGVVVYDRPLRDMFVEAEHPYVQVCPSPAPDYFWGYSEVERLIPLQDMRNKRMIQIRKMMDRQANPPRSYSGYMVTDEMNRNLDTPGGYTSTDMPNAKVEPFSPEIPEDLFREVREIDAMFEEASGINNVLAGRGEQGVRSAGHASQLAKLGSSRPKARALMIEDSLEAQATRVLQILQKFSKKRLRGEDGAEFVLDQFTKDYRVKVDAHSNSPIFMEDSEAKAFELLKAKAIDREELLDLVSIPTKQLLKQKLRRKIIPAEQKAAQQEQALKLRGVAGGKS